jgi:hypothetical protein
METYTCSPLPAKSAIRDAYWANRMPCDVALTLFAISAFVALVAMFNL